MNLKFALHYSAQGFHVLPTHYERENGECSCGWGNCRSKFKHPITKNGVLDATTDKEVIKRWWSKGNWNVAFRTGPESGFWALDVDDLLALNKLDELPETMVAATPRGAHHYFLWEPEITNRAKIYGLPIDVRGANGYVLCPPSRGYSWSKTSPIVKAPSWLVKAVKKG